MTTIARTLAVLAGLLVHHALLAQDQPPVDNVGHTRHHHPRNPPHPAGPDATRFVTNREGPPLPLPAERDAFVFAVFGDRTGGPAEGVAVLADAVRDVNLFEPDLVMTVGDLVEGYNTTAEWLVQMREFRGVMDHLIMPWFPVAGNHDTYWRGPGRPEREHEANYEAHFAPLWYAFEHKNCWFIALYSDESNPVTGEKNFDKPECQVMSEEQFRWLGETLERARDARHVFVFLHHPRWLGGNYGDDWERVHRLLASAGNVRVVFAGHIHRMRHDGPRDGIEYVTLATVGGAQSHRVPQAGWLHHYHLVTVRDDQIALAAVPVGQAMDVREITGELTADAARLLDLRATIDAPVRLDADAVANQTVAARIENPVGRPIEVTVRLESADSRWSFVPDHAHRVIPPGEAVELEFHAHRMRGGFDPATRTVDVVLETDYLADSARYSIPEVREPLPIAVELTRPPQPRGEWVLGLDGRTAHAMVPAHSIELEDGPLTLECWMRAERFGRRTGLVTRTENSEFGIFVSGGVPSFSIHLDGRYAEAKADRAILEIDRWYHVAGVFDGRETRLYVDGVLIGRVARSGRRTTNRLPLIIGGDVDGRGKPTSLFEGQIDAVRLTAEALYEGETFTPARRPRAGARTIFLFNMDGVIGPWIYDESGRDAHAVVSETAVVRPARGR